MPLLKEYSHAKALLAQDEVWLSQVTGLDRQNLAVLKSPTREQQLLKQFQDAESHGVQFISYLDERYPKRLREIGTFPLVLFCCGDVGLLNAPQILAIVGTRQISSYGKKVLQEFIPKLVEKNFVIVSGMAFGIDASAHKMTLEQGGKTIAIQAQGVDQGYPRRHHKLFEEVVQKGLVVSEFLSKPVAMGAAFFPRRNRLLSGVSDGVLVVEAALQSGSLITAQFALDQNRDVFAVPGDIFSKWSSGCHALIGQGARPMTSVADLLGEVPQKWGTENIAPNLIKHSTLDQFSSPLEIQIYELCVSQTMTLDDLIEKTGEMPQAILACVTKMELQGFLQEQPGKRFSFLQK